MREAPRKNEWISASHRLWPVDGCGVRRDAILGTRHALVKRVEEMLAAATREEAEEDATGEDDGDDEEGDRRRACGDESSARRPLAPLVERRT